MKKTDSLQSYYFVFYYFLLIYSWISFIIYVLLNLHVLYFPLLVVIMSEQDL